MTEQPAIAGVVEPYQTDHFKYLVQSDTTAEKYVVDIMEFEQTGACNCMHYLTRIAPKVAKGLRGPQARCKHISRAREFALDFLLPKFAKELGMEEPDIKLVNPEGNSVYTKARNDFLQKNTRCAVYPNLRSIEPHHSRGRLGMLLHDQRFWIPVSRLGHNLIHDNPDKARAMTWNGIPLLCAKGDWNRQP